MSYDTTEAKNILARAHAERAREPYKAARRRASIELLEAVVKAAREASYRVDGASGVYAVIEPNHGQVLVSIEDDRIVLRVEDFPKKGDTSSFGDLAIEYDPFAGTYVGKEYDDTIVPTPGEYRRRRSPVTVMAERIVELIDEQAKTKQSAR